MLDQAIDNFILIPAKSGGGALVKRSQVVGSRANGIDGSILYLATGPSVYTTATIPQLAGFFEAEVAQMRD